MIAPRALTGALGCLLTGALLPLASAENVATGCQPVVSYHQAIGTRPLADSERARIKGAAWHSGSVLYVDLYNGNHDVTLTALNIRVIPETPNAVPAGQAGVPCDPVAGTYDRHLHRLAVMIPPETASQSRFRVPDIPPGGRFTWEIGYAEGHQTSTPYPWHLWR